MRAGQGRRSGARGLAWLVVIATALPLACAPAYADNGGPSAAAVAAGKARVAALERQVRAAAEAVAGGQARLDRLRTAAEVAVEAFDRAQVLRAAAARSLDAADLVLSAATARVHDARAGVARFAAAAYEGGTLSSLDVLLTSHGPDTMLYRLSALDAVARSQRDVVEELSAATVYQHVVQQQATEALVHARAAAADADAARRHAAAAVATQTTAVAHLTTAQHRLTRVLADARAHATALERARLAAIARARAAAAAAAARRAAAAAAAAAAASAQNTPAGVGTSPQQFATTVSEATELAALHDAQSQIGKPYEWGAAGPDTYDCSGLVMWSYAQVGVHVDHWTGYQWNEGAHIPLSALRPGDLLFFATDTSNPDTIHHVGIYAGNAQMVEAPYTGADVRTSYAFRPDLIGAVRLYDR